LKSQLESLVRQMQDVGIVYAEAVEEFRRVFIAMMLEKHNGNHSRAARALGVHRNTVTRAIKAFGIVSKHPESVPDKKLDTTRWRA